MSWKIEYPYEDVQQFILQLPSGLSARYFHLTELISEFGSNLGMPHTKSMSNGLFELRIKGSGRNRQGVLLHQGRQTYCHASWLYKEISENSQKGVTSSRTSIVGGKEK